MGLKVQVLLATIGLFSAQVWAAAPEAKPVNCPRSGLIVLVPGTFNNISPGSIENVELRAQLEISPYYSIEILNVVRATGKGVLIVKGLSPLGDFTENGIETGKVVSEFYRANCKPGTPITMLGHSSGGLYSMKAAQIHPDLPIEKILMISTPLHGFQVADKIVKNRWAKGFFDNLVEGAAFLVDLRELLELTSDYMAKFLDETPIPNRVQVVTGFGYQPAPSTLLQGMNARYLSPLFFTVSQFIDGVSDGCVDQKSAWGVEAQIKYADGGLVTTKKLADYIHVDHSKQVMDYRIYGYTGTQEASIIRD